MEIERNEAAPLVEYLQTWPRERSSEAKELLEGARAEFDDYADVVVITPISAKEERPEDVAEYVAALEAEGTANKNVVMFFNAYEEGSISEDYKDEIISIAEQSNLPITALFKEYPASANMKIIRGDATDAAAMLYARKYKGRASPVAVSVDVDMRNFTSGCFGEIGSRVREDASKFYSCAASPLETGNAPIDRLSRYFYAQARAFNSPNCGFAAFSLDTYASMVETPAWQHSLRADKVLGESVSFMYNLALAANPNIFDGLDDYPSRVYTVKQEALVQLGVSGQHSPRRTVAGCTEYGGEFGSWQYYDGFTTEGGDPARVPLQDNLQILKQRGFGEADANKVITNGVDMVFAYLLALAPNPEEAIKGFLDGLVEEDIISETVRGQIQKKVPTSTRTFSY